MALIKIQPTLYYYCLCLYYRCVCCIHTHTHTRVQLLVSECFCSCIYVSVSQTDDICQILLFDLDEGEAQNVHLKKNNEEKHCRMIRVLWAWQNFTEEER